MISGGHKLLGLTARIAMALFSSLAATLMALWSSLRSRPYIHLPLDLPLFIERVAHIRTRINHKTWENRPCVSWVSCANLKRIFCTIYLSPPPTPPMLEGRIVLCSSGSPSSDTVGMLVIATDSYHVTLPQCKAKAQQ